METDSTPELEHWRRRAQIAEQDADRLATEVAQYGGATVLVNDEGMSVHEWRYFRSSSRALQAHEQARAARTEAKMVSTN